VVTRTQDTAAHLDEAREDILAFTAFPPRDLSAHLVEQRRSG